MADDSYDDSVHEYGCLATGLTNERLGILRRRPGGIRTRVEAQAACLPEARLCPMLLIALHSMTTAPPSESTPQRLAVIREQLTLLADYL